MTKVACQKMLLVTSLGVVIPLSLLLWILNIFFHRFSSQEYDVWKPLSPYRLIIAALVPLFIAKWGLKKRSLDRSGALAGILVGFILTISNYGFCGALMAFFVSASKATKFRKEKKRALEEDFKEGGQRNWVQVLCNGGIAAEIAIIFMIDSGCGEFPVDFVKRYSSSWLTLAVLGALSCSSGDTYASEIGGVTGKKDPWLITTLNRVPRGTNGGVSVMGLLSSVIGGSIVGMGFYMAHILSTCDAEGSPQQWLVIVITAIAGFVGSLIDSILGATLQYSGYDKEKNKIVAVPGDDVEFISGSPILDNHGVNLLASLLTALVTPSIGLIVHNTAANMH